MARYQGWFALVLALAIAAGMFLVRTPLELGLDLRGGSQLTVEVKPAGEITRVGAEEIEAVKAVLDRRVNGCLLYTSPSPRDFVRSRMPSSA